MKVEDIMTKINSIHNGTWFNIIYLNEVPVLAAFKKTYHIDKYTSTTVRKGVHYQNLAAYKKQLAMCDNAKLYEKLTKPLELPWGKWMEGHEGYIIEHTNKAGEYKQYLRMYTSPNKPKSTYFLNGKPITRTEIEGMNIVSPSYWNKSNETGTMTITLDKIVRIGK